MKHGIDEIRNKAKIHYFLPIVRYANIVQLHFQQKIKFVGSGWGNLWEEYNRSCFKICQERFDFEDNFLFVDINLRIMLGIPFFSLSNVDLWFTKSLFEEMI